MAAALALAGLCACARPASAAGGGGALVRCESVNFRDHYCPISSRSDVRLARQISRAPCRHGSSWGYDRHGIWVSEGCGAEFEVLPRDAHRSRAPRIPEHDAGHGPRERSSRGRGDQVVCESRDYRYRYCPVRQANDVEMLRQISTSNCRFQRSWGFDRGGIWVDQGCGAVFLVR